MSEQQLQVNKRLLGKNQELNKKIETQHHNRQNASRDHKMHSYFQPEDTGYLEAEGLEKTLQFR